MHLCRGMIRQSRADERENGAGGRLKAEVEETAGSEVRSPSAEPGETGGKKQKLFSVWSQNREAGWRGGRGGRGCNRKRLKEGAGGKGGILLGKAECGFLRCRFVSRLGGPVTKLPLRFIRTYLHQAMRKLPGDFPLTKPLPARSVFLPLFLPVREANADPKLYIK